jgi:NAD(P)-dependent dehydrogenase (short-subunit alcohol dehydrogenase family)
MNIKDSVVLVAGAKRGLGQAFVDALAQPARTRSMRRRATQKASGSPVSCRSGST